MSEVVRIGRGVFERLLSEARIDPEIECCGLLAGRDGVISAVLPATERLAERQQPTRLRPQELFALFRRMRAKRSIIWASTIRIPHGENSPSSRDIERAFYPEAAYFIVSPATRGDSPGSRFSHSRWPGPRDRSADAFNVEAGGGAGASKAATVRCRTDRYAACTNCAARSQE